MGGGPAQWPVEGASPARRLLSPGCPEPDSLASGLVLPSPLLAMYQGQVHVPQACHGKYRHWPFPPSWL